MNHINIYANGNINIEVVGNELVINGKVVPKSFIKGEKINFHKNSSIVQTTTGTTIKFKGGNKIVVKGDKVIVNSVNLNEIDNCQENKTNRQKMQTKIHMLFVHA